MIDLYYQIANDQLSHAYIFESRDVDYNVDYAIDFSSKIFRAKGFDLNLESNPDLYIIDKGNDVIDIETIRLLIKDSALKPSNGKIKIYIIHNAQNLRVESSNALLKTVEELKSYNMMIFTTTNAMSLLPTIRSRCQIINLSSKKQDLDIDLFKLSEIMTKVYGGDMGYYYQNKSFFSEKKEEKDLVIDGFLEVFSYLIVYKYGDSEKVQSELAFNLDKLSTMNFNQIDEIVNLLHDIKQGFRTNINYELSIERVIFSIFKGGMK